MARIEVLHLTQKIDYPLATFTCQKYTVLIERLLLLAVNKSQVSAYWLTKERNIVTLHILIVVLKLNVCSVSERWNYFH